MFNLKLNDNFVKLVIHILEHKEITMECLFESFILS